MRRKPTMPRPKTREDANGTPVQWCHKTKQSQPTEKAQSTDGWTAPVMKVKVVQGDCFVLKILDVAGLKV